MSGSEAGQGWYDPNMYGAPGALGAGVGYGQERTGGIAGGQDNGYNGQVNSLKDFISAVLGGAGTVFGGFPGALAAGVNLATGAKHGLGTLAAIKDLFGSKDASGPTLSGGNIDLSGPTAQAAGAVNAAGNLAGPMGAGLSGLGDITGGGDRMGGGPDLSGGDRGAAGDRTAEARGFSHGGALNIAIRGRKKR